MLETLGSEIDLLKMPETYRSSYQMYRDSLSPTVTAISMHRGVMAPAKACLPSLAAVVPSESLSVYRQHISGERRHEIREAF